jgi:5-methylcytosine-specific restriction endonuclease McrA
MVYKDPDYQKKYRERNREKNKEKQKEYYEKNKDDRKRKKKEYYENNGDKIKDSSAKYYEKNKEKIDEKNAKYLEDRKQHALDSISVGEIIDKNKWDMWCKEIKRCAIKSKHPYSDDFTNDIMFEMMIQGCFYCGNIATTIDRVDSKLDHTLENCIGCCYGCNNSKGAADPSTFIRKAYYRARRKYYDDDTDIWFIYKSKPGFAQYKSHANKKRVSFELTKEYFDDLTKEGCKYCRRSPTTYFGVDRIVPSLGYIIDNVVSCCFDCNIDKFEDDVVTMIERNERIAYRVDAGECIIAECEKVILHTGRK